MEIAAFQESDRSTLSKLYDEVRLRTFTWMEKDSISLGTFDEDIMGELVLVARVNGEVAGFIGIWEPDAFIHHLYVLPENQGRGVGQGLVKAGLARCQSAATLKCLTANHRAIAFYQRNGWIAREEGVSPEGDYILFEYSASAR